MIFYLDPWPSTVLNGRSAFYIHWDNAKKDYSASEGCVIPLTNVFDRLLDGEVLVVTA